MRFKVNFFRILVIPACIAWGLVEFVCLQRSRWVMRRSGLPTLQR